jgi:hypothetical protein
MEPLRLEPQRLRFPARCIYRGASPSHQITIETWKGIDLVYIAWGHYCSLVAPACGACTRKRRRARILFRVAQMVFFVGGIIGGGLAMGAWPSSLPVKTAVFEEVSYRSPQVIEPPPVWQGPPKKEMARWAKVVLASGFAALMFLVGWLQFQNFAELERTGGSITEHALIILLYDLGGKYTVLGFFWLVGLLLTGATVSYVSPRADAWLARLRRKVRLGSRT